MERIKAVFNWSGGKDSAHALLRAMQSGKYEIVALLTTVNRDTHRSTMHGIPTALLQAQADSIGIPLHIVDLTPKGNMEDYGAAMSHAVEHFKAQGVTCFIFGDIFLHDVRKYRERQLAPHGIGVAEPLWGESSGGVTPEPHHLSDAVLYKEFEEHPMVVVCGTVGEDEHSVGLREIINIKHGGIEKWGVKVHYLGTSVPVEKLVDAAVELNANAILASTIISHDNVHYKNMKRINELAVEKGIRDRVIIAAGGTQVIPDEAVKTGIDQGFGRDSHGIDVATFLAEEAMRRRGEL